MRIPKTNIPEFTPQQPDRNNQEFHVYLGRKISKRNIQHTNIRDYQGPELIPPASDTYTGMESSTHEPLVPFVDESTLPITARQDV